MSLQLGHGDAIPAVLPSEQERNEDFLKAAHHVLMEVLHSTYNDQTLKMQLGSVL